MDTPLATEADAIHFVYFTCGRHWPYFIRSLSSLLRLRSKHVATIHTYVDSGDCFNSEQLEALNTLSPGINIMKSRRVTGWGEQTVAVETQVFADMSKHIHPGSVIAKTDSDVIFRADKAFSAVISLGADLAGLAYDRHAPFVYPSGGCYFIKSRIAGDLQHYPQDIFEETLSMLNNADAQKRGAGVFDYCPEDAVMYAIVKRMGGQVAYVPQFSRSIMHFSGQKDEMLKYDQRLYWLFRYHFRPSIARLVPAGLGNGLRRLGIGKRNRGRG